jgi:hypothetical protein
MGLHQIKKLLHRKGNNYQNQDNSQTREKSFPAIHWRKDIQNIQRAQKIKHKE